MPDWRCQCGIARTDVGRCSARTNSCAHALRTPVPLARLARWSFGRHRCAAPACVWVLPSGFDAVRLVTLRLLKWLQVVRHARRLSRPLSQKKRYAKCCTRTFRRSLLISIECAPAPAVSACLHASCSSEACCTLRRTSHSSTRCW